MDKLLAAYQHADWSAYAISQYRTFATSSTRVDVRDECPVNYACSKDDARFIDDPKENDKRVQSVFEIIDWRCRDTTQSRSTDVLVELLEGREEDIWLWVDGDEANLPKANTRRLHEYGQLAAVRSLNRRRQPMAPMLPFEK